MAHLKKLEGKGQKSHYLDVAQSSCTCTWSLLWLHSPRHKFDDWINQPPVLSIPKQFAFIAQYLLNSLMTLEAPKKSRGLAVHNTTSTHLYL